MVHHELRIPPSPTLLSSPSQGKCFPHPCTQIFLTRLQHKHAQTVTDNFDRRGALPRHSDLKYLLSGTTLWEHACLCKPRTLRASNKFLQILLHCLIDLYCCSRGLSPPTAMTPDYIPSELPNLPTNVTLETCKQPSHEASRILFLCFPADWSLHRRACCKQGCVAGQQVVLSAGCTASPPAILCCRTAEFHRNGT